MSAENEPDNDLDRAGERPTSKVARLIETYDLGEEFGDRLEELWTTDGDERRSLRSLADTFNERLLEAAMAAADVPVIDGEVSNRYRLLKDDDVSSGQRVEARNRLEQEGIDVEQLEQDFVTYQAIRSYLKDYRGAEYDGRSDETRVDTVVGTIRRLKSRTRSVVRSSLERLQDQQLVALGEFRLFVEVDVLCEDCDTQYGVVELLERGGCECERE